MKAVISILLLSVFTWFFQKVEKKSIAPNTNSNLAAESTQIHLSFFDIKDIPDSLWGCSELYAFDRATIKKNKFILYSDLNNNAMLKINGRLIFFRIEKVKIQGKEISLTFSGHGYKVKFTSIEIKKIDMEYWHRDGSLEIEKGNVKKTFRLEGAYGC